MISSRSRRLAVASLVPLLLIVTAAGASATKPPDKKPKRHDVTWTNEAPPIAIGAPLCTDGGQCQFPWTEQGTAHGDLEGTYIASGVATVNAVGALAVSRMDTFTGTVAGCGTGTFVFRSIEDLGPTPKPTQWQVVEGFGTGDLTTLEGHGEGVGAQTPTGVTSTLSGTVTCRT